MGVYIHDTDHKTSISTRQPLPSGRVNVNECVCINGLGSAGAERRSKKLHVIYNSSSLSKVRGQSMEQNSPLSSFFFSVYNHRQRFAQGWHQTSQGRASGGWLRYHASQARGNPEQSNPIWKEILNSDKKESNNSSETKSVGMSCHFSLSLVSTLLSKLGCGRTLVKTTAMKISPSFVANSSALN